MNFSNLKKKSKKVSIFEEVFLPKTIKISMKINENHEKSGEKSENQFCEKS